MLSFISPLSLSALGYHAELDRIRIYPGTRKYTGQGLLRRVLNNLIAWQLLYHPRLVSEEVGWAEYLAALLFHKSQWVPWHVLNHWYWSLAQNAYLNLKR